MDSMSSIKNPEMSDHGKNWNVVTGCDKYSDGGMNCYAEENGFNLTCHYDRLNWPLKQLANKPKRPAKSFVTDMGDLFHEKVPDGFISQVFGAILQFP